MTENYSNSNIQYRLYISQRYAMHYALHKMVHRYTKCIADRQHTRWKECKQQQQKFEIKWSHILSEIAKEKYNLTKRKKE